MNIDLANKTAIVTGATGDLGRVMVRTLADCGADVIIHYLHNQSKALELQMEDSLVQILNAPCKVFLPNLLMLQERGEWTVFTGF